MDVEQALVQLLREFTSKVAAVVRQNALDSAGAALGAVANGSGRPALQAARRSAPPAKAARRPAAAKQPLDAEAVGDQVVSYLMSKPGLRTEELGAALKVPTDGLKPLIKKLVTGGRLRSEGVARGTRYFAAAARSSNAGARRRKAKAGPARRGAAAKPGRKRAKKS
jgi:hypothetical protein